MHISAVAPLASGEGMIEAGTYIQIGIYLSFHARRHMNFDTLVTISGSRTSTSERRRNLIVGLQVLHLKLLSLAIATPIVILAKIVVICFKYRLAGVSRIDDP